MNPHIGDRKYLVTGASGYVGGRLVRALIEDKENVRILVRDKNKIMGQPWELRSTSAKAVQKILVIYKCR